MDRIVTYKKKRQKSGNLNQEIHPFSVHFPISGFLRRKISVLFALLNNPSPKLRHLPSGVSELRSPTFIRSPSDYDIRFFLRYHRRNQQPLSYMHGSDP